MKAIFFPPLFSFGLVSVIAAETCRKIVRDSSGRIKRTIVRQRSSDGTVQTVTRDGSGRIIGTSTTRPDSHGRMHTEYRDARSQLTDGDPPRASS
jgi:YD repeat-containing protein